MQLQDAFFQEGIRLVPCHSEMSAAVAAEYWGRNHPSGCGVVLVTTGPGVTNTLTPAVASWLDSRPLIIISGQVKSTDLQVNNQNLRHYGVQYVDTKGVFSSILKMFHSLTALCSIAQTFDSLFRESISGRPGPVLLEIPIDLQQREELPPASPIIYQDVHPTFDKVLNKVDTFIRDILLPALQGSRRPLLLVGSGVLLARTPLESFNKLINTLNIPICNTWGSIQLVDSDHPNYFGRPGVVAKRTANFVVQNCDLILSIGCRLDLITTAYNPANFAKSSESFFVIDVDPQELVVHEQLGRHVFACSADVFISRLIYVIEASGSISVTPHSDQWLDFCASLKDRYDSVQATRNTAEIATKEGWSNYLLVEQLSHEFQDKDVIVTGSSGHCTEVFYSHFRPKQGQTIHHSNALGSMGFGLPAAIGTAIAQQSYPTRPVFLLETDGSFNVNLQELSVLSAQSLNIIILLNNNGGYLSIKNGQKSAFGGRLSAVDSSTGLVPPSYELLARSYGINYQRCETPESLAAVFRQIRDSDHGVGPLIVEIITTSDEILIPKCAPQRSSSGAIISMPLEDLSPLLPYDELIAALPYTSIDPISLAVRGN